MSRSPEKPIYKSLKSAHLHMLRPQARNPQPGTTYQQPHRNRHARPRPACDASDRCVHPRRPDWGHWVRRVAVLACSPAPARARLWRGTRTNLTPTDQPRLGPAGHNTTGMLAVADIVAFSWPRSLFLVPYQIYHFSIHVPGSRLRKNARAISQLRRVRQAQEGPCTCTIRACTYCMCIAMMRVRPVHHPRQSALLSSTGHRAVATKIISGVLPGPILDRFLAGGAPRRIYERRQQVAERTSWTRRRHEHELLVCDRDILDRRTAYSTYM